MKTPTKTQSARTTEAARQARRRERFLSKTHANGNIQRFIGEALKYLRPEQIEELVTILMQFSSSSRHLQDGIITAEELIRVFTKDASQGAFISSSASETYEQSKFHFTTLSEGDSQAVIEAAKDRIALDLQRKLTILFSEKLGTQVQRIVEQEPRGASRESLLPTAVKDDISVNTYGKQHREGKMSDKVQDAIRKGEHPGAFIYRELIRPSGQTLEFIANKIGVHWTSLSYLKNGRTNLSLEMAAKLSHYFGKYSTQQLLAIQSVQDAKKADQDYLASLPHHQNPSPL